MEQKTTEEAVEYLMRHPIPRRRVGIVRLQMIRERHSLYGMKRFSSPGEIVQMMKPLLELADREILLVLSLNNRLEPMALEIAAVGSLYSCEVQPREVFKHAVLSNAAFIVAVHNHPSGDVIPSTEDRAITRRLAECGGLLGIPFIDHIIVGQGNQYYSFKENGMLYDSSEGE